MKMGSDIVIMLMFYLRNFICCNSGTTVVGFMMYTVEMYSGG